MSDPILSREEVRSERYRYPDSTTEDGANDVIALADSHEALRAENTRLSERVATLEAALREWHEAYWAKVPYPEWIRRLNAADDLTTSVLGDQVAPTEPTCGTIPPNVLTHTLCLLPNEHAGPHEYERRCADRIDAWGDQTWRFCDHPLGHSGAHQAPDGTTWPAAPQVAPTEPTCEMCNNTRLIPRVPFTRNGARWAPCPSCQPQEPCGVCGAMVFDGVCWRADYHPAASQVAPEPGRLDALPWGDMTADEVESCLYPGCTGPYSHIGACIPAPAPEPERPSTFDLLAGDKAAWDAVVRPKSEREHTDECPVYYEYIEDEGNVRCECPAALLGEQDTDE